MEPSILGEIINMANWESSMKKLISPFVKLKFQCWFLISKIKTSKFKKLFVAKNIPLHWILKDVFFLGVKANYGVLDSLNISILKHRPWVIQRPKMFSFQNH
jgi:hypothetical protein